MLNVYNRTKHAFFLISSIYSILSKNQTIIPLFFPISGRSREYYYPSLAWMGWHVSAMCLTDFPKKRGAMWSIFHVQRNNVLVQWFSCEYSCPSSHPTLRGEAFAVALAAERDGDSDRKGCKYGDPA